MTKAVRKLKKKLKKIEGKGGITIKPGTGWFEKAMRELNEKEKKQ